MNKRSKIFILLSSAYCVVVVTGNLIFQKFVHFNLFGFFSFEVSVGILPFPLTFLIIDLIADCYGKEWAKTTVLVGALVSLLVMGLVFLADQMAAVPWSPVNNEVFHLVFHAYGIASIASLVSNYLAQLCGIVIFIWLKDFTNSRHLWLRNNVNTIVAQLIDTVLVISILCFVDILPWNKWLIITSNSFFLKVIMAICDTPFCYLGHYWLNRKILPSAIS